MSDDRNIVYEQEGRVIYRASSLGLCSRALVAARLGYDPSPPPETLQQIFDAGSDAENWVTSVHKVHDAQAEVRLGVPGTNAAIVGHVDGMRMGRVVEIKSQSPAEYDRWTRDSFDTNPLWRKYAWQMSVYMHALRVGLEVVRVRRETAGEGYTYSIDHFDIPFVPLQTIWNRVQKLEEMAAAEELPECNVQSFGCPYWKFHEGPEINVDDELDQACQELRYRQVATARIKEQLDEALEQEKAVKTRVVKIMEKNYPEEVDGDKKTRAAVTEKYKVKWSEYPKKEYVVKARVEQRLTVTEVKE